MGYSEILGKEAIDGLSVELNGTGIKGLYKCYTGSHSGWDWSDLANSYCWKANETVILVKTFYFFGHIYDFNNLALIIT